MESKNKDADDYDHFEIQLPKLRADLGRNALTLGDLRDKYHFRRGAPIKITQKVKKCAKATSAAISRISILAVLSSLVPPITWIPKYDFKKNIAADLVAGFTVAIMHIPQGMAYGLLAGVDPVVGIYTAFFPVLLYVFFGTMPHVSMGSFAVISIMVAKPVARLGSDVDDPTEAMNEENIYSTIQVATAVTFCVGLIQLIAGIGRLGFLSMVLTDTVVSSFTVGASFHVITSQIKHVLGIRIPRHAGIGRLVLTYYDLGRKVPTTNLITLAISAATIAVSLFIDLFIGPKLKTKCRFPLPTQLSLIILFTTLSHFLGFRDIHHVRTIESIGEIPTGLPYPTFPLLKLIPMVFADALAPAIVSFTVGVGLGKMFGKKHGYKVQENQELLGQGVSNIFGSMFSCIPMSGSLSRSVVQEASGCKSQLTSLTSAFLLLWVLLYLGPLFKTLPVCVLASIILASLVGIVKKVMEVRKYFALSTHDGFIWLITFLSTVLLDVDYGLIVGVSSSLILTFVRATVPSIRVLEKGEDGVWLNKKYFKTEGGIKVIQLMGPVNFLVKDLVRSWIKAEVSGSTERYSSNDSFRPTEDIVLDITGVSYLDRVGAGLIPWLERIVKQDGHSLGVVATLHQSSSLKLDCQIFPTYTDAIVILTNVSKPKEEEQIEIEKF